jgi:hypothetical protein
MKQAGVSQKPKSGRGISGETVQLYFRGFPAVDRGVRFIFVEFPCVDVPHRSLE